MREDFNPITETNRPVWQGTVKGISKNQAIGSTYNFIVVMQCSGQQDLAMALKGKKIERFLEEKITVGDILEFLFSVRKSAILNNDGAIIDYRNKIVATYFKKIGKLE